MPHFVIGLALTALLTLLNYRGIRLSATFQNWTSFGTLGLFVVFVALGVSRGSPANIQPLFTHTPLISILLVIQIVPYFMTGFESVGKAAEEASPQLRPWYGRLSRGKHPRPAPDAFDRRSLREHRRRCLYAVGGRDPRSGHRGRIRRAASGVQQVLGL